MGNDKPSEAVESEDICLQVWDLVERKIPYPFGKAWVYEVWNAVVHPKWGRGVSKKILITEDKQWELFFSWGTYANLGINSISYSKYSASSRYDLFRLRIFSFLVELKLWKWIISISWRKSLAVMSLVTHVMIHVQSY